MAEEKSAPKSLGNVETKEPEFRELTRRQTFDRQTHIQKSLEMGMSREEAERHADQDLKDRDDAHP